MKRISISDFLSACENVSVPAMMSDVYANVVKFYTVYSQDSLYQICGTEDELKAVFSGCSDVYNRFGIFSKDTADGIYSTEDNNRICIVDNVDSVFECIEVFESKYGQSPKYLAVLDSVTEGLRIQLESKFPKCTLMNRVSRTVTSHTNSRNPNYDYVDISDVISNGYLNSTDANLNLRKAKDVLHTLKHSEHGPTTIFCIRDDLSSELQGFYVDLAAILTYHGLNFDIPIQLRSIFIHSVQRPMTSNFMMLNDYLNKITNPLSVAVSIVRNNAFLCILEADAYGRYPSIDLELTIYASKLNKENYTMVSREIENMRMPYKELRILDPVDTFQLNGDWRHGHRKLSELLTEFEGVVAMDIGLSNETSLNFTNTMIFEYDDELYVAYIPRIPDVSYQYSFIPLCARYKAFRQTLSRDDYDHLLDVNVFVERDALLLQTDRFAFQRMRHFEIPRFLDGAVIRSFPPSTNLLNESCHFTFPEVGIWSIQCDQGRTSALNTLLSRFNRQDLHEKRFLTFWGGCHPMDLTSVEINYQAWR